jgi:hypothetical protein
MMMKERMILDKISMKKIVPLPTRDLQTIEEVVRGIKIE